MSRPDFSGMLRWPNVPACYGWLALDRRGVWRLRGEPVTHHGLLTFLNRQYAHDEAGNYFVQNGPQRVFVVLEYTPWVLWLTANECGALVLQSHTGEAVETINHAYLDDEGNLLLELPVGIALVSDRDLPGLLTCLHHLDGRQAEDDALLSLLEGASSGTDAAGSLVFHWHDQRIPVSFIRRAEVPEGFAFVSAPQEGAQP